MIHINSKVEEITEQGKFLYQSYCIWSEIVDPRKNTKNRELLDTSPELFDVIAESLFGSIVITICALCEKNREDVLSIYSITKNLSNIYPTLELQINKILMPYEPEIELLVKIRHKVYAHRDKNICPESVFRQINITPERIHSCISTILEILDLINTTTGVKTKGTTTLDVLNEVDIIKRSLHRFLLRQ